MPALARIFITGFGLVTPLGLGAWQTFAALLAGRAISDRAAGLPADIAGIDLARAIGCVAAAQHAADDPAIELAERAAAEAGVGCRVSGVGSEQQQAVSAVHPIPELPTASHDPIPALNPKPETRNPKPAPRPLPTFLGTSKGAFRTFDEAAAFFARHGASAMATPASRSRCEVVALGAGEYMARQLEKRLNIHVMHHAVAACASSLVALHRARLALLHRQVEGDRALVLTADAALTPSLIHAYRRLGVLAPLTTADYACRPLDRRRQGFVLAEAGAAVLLQRVEAGAGSDVIASLPRDAVELIDTGEACDAFDLIRPNPQMPAVGHLAESLLTGRDIDLIHPHAPGTMDHDPAELSVYHQHAAHMTAKPASGCRPKPAAPPTLNCYAHKGALGHTLGASGLVSLVIACLCARAQRCPPMPWLREPIEHAGIRGATASNPIRTQAIFAAGFGGHAAGAVIQNS